MLMAMAMWLQHGRAPGTRRKFARWGRERERGAKERRRDDVDAETMNVVVGDERQRHFLDDGLETGPNRIPQCDVDLHRQRPVGRLSSWCLCVCLHPSPILPIPLHHTHIVYHMSKGTIDPPYSCLLTRQHWPRRPAPRASRSGVPSGCVPDIRCLVLASASCTPTRRCAPRQSKQLLRRGTEIVSGPSAQPPADDHQSTLSRMTLTAHVRVESSAFRSL